MVANERGNEGDADGFGGSPADDPVDLLADAEEEDTAAVVERLRESGPCQHVSAESVDEVLSELDGDGSATDDGGAGESDAGVEQDAEDRDGDADGEASGGLVGGGPTTTVSQEGIDEVFEKLEAETPDRGDDVAPSGEDETLEETVSDPDPTDAASGTSSSGDGFGTLAGGGPTTTVSDESVDDVLSQVGDDGGYATFDGDDAPDLAAETEVDPDAVFPDDWETTGDDGGDVPEPDEHTPAEDVDDLRPDDADDGALDLFADVAEEVNEGSSTAEAPAEAAGATDGTDVDLTESADGLFENEPSGDDRFEDDSPDADPDSIADDFAAADEFAEDNDVFAASDDDFAPTDDAEGESDGLDPGLADEVDALLSAADDVDSGPESEATVDSLNDAEVQDGSDATSASQARQDASSQTGRDEESSSESSSRLALNTSDDAGIEWSEGGTDAEGSRLAPETTEAAASDSAEDGGATPEDEQVDEDDGDEAPGDERSFAGLRYARAAAGWLRSLLARLA